MPTFLLAMLAATVTNAAPASSHWTTPYNVIWTSPSHDAAGSMPLGNGQLGISLWVEEDGDLRFYICRNDSFTEVSRLVKIGGVRLALDPNPFKAGAPFRQELRLCDGACEITAGEGRGTVTLKIFVDSDYPVIHVIGRSASPLRVTATADVWRTAPHRLAGEELKSSWTLHGSPTPVIEAADIFPSATGDAVVRYHRNETSSAFAATLKVQSLESAADKAYDPLLHRTFGAYMAGEGLHASSDHSLKSTSPVQEFSLRIAAPCSQTASAQAWIDEGKRLVDVSAQGDRAARTAAAWQAFWDRSWVIVDGDQAEKAPGSEHPLRIGYDSDGSNKFSGEIEQIRVYGKALADEEIARLAKSASDKVPASNSDLVLSGSGEPREIAAASVALGPSFTLEASIKPSALSPGRIFDRVTAGGSDGFLFDTHPGDTLRLVVGSTTLTAPRGILKAGRSYHAAATYDAATGAMRVYLDGRLVAKREAATSNSISRGYALQRYTQACGGRGPFPIKFNGGMFTVEPKSMGKPYNADWRAWGDCFWWQNTRHMYHPMLAAGDFDLMDPLFATYERDRPLAEARSRLYHGAEGCYFPETMTVWGTYSNGDYGWNRKGHQPKDVLCPYWQYAWNQGPELVDLLLDRWDYTGDEAFLDKQVLPMAESVLKYFDTRFKKDADGRIVLDPTQSIETYWQGVINDMPSTAGLNDITTRLCALPERLTTPQQREFFRKMHAACPTVPLRHISVGGVKEVMLSPAQKYSPNVSNCENPELYAVWPFRLYGLGRPGIEVARAAYAARHNHLDSGWGYDGNCAALLGLTDEAARILKIKCANSHSGYRWPATWGPNFDWLPDQNHGGNLLETAQLMLLQPVGDKILVLPAWPGTWDVSFKLHAPQSTLVECIYRGGKVVKLEVTPASRRGDVILPEPSEGRDRIRPE